MPSEKECVMLEKIDDGTVVEGEKIAVDPASLPENRNADGTVKTAEQITAEDEAAEAEAAAEAERVAAEDEKLSLASQDRVQARIDGLIELNNRQARENAELKAKLDKGSSGEQKYTKAQVIAILQDDARSAQDKAWAVNELSLMNAREAVEERVGKVEQGLKVTEAMRNSMAKAEEEFPDILDTSTPLWKLADKIYIEQGLANIADGQYIAAQLAAARLGKATTTNAKQLANKLGKANAKTALAGTTQKVVSSDSSVLDKLEKAAVGTRADSPEWKAVLKQMEKMRVKKG